MGYVEFGWVGCEVDVKLDGGGGRRSLGLAADKATCISPSLQTPQLYHHNSIFQAQEYISSNAYAEIPDWALRALMEIKTMTTEQISRSPQHQSGMVANAGGAAGVGLHEF